LSTKNPFSVGLTAYQVLLVGGLLAIVLWAIGHGATTVTWPAVVGLAGVAAIAERGRVRLAPTVEASISLIPTVFAAVLFGPLAGVVVGTSSFLLEVPPLLSSDALPPSPYARWLTYSGIRGVSGGLAGLAAWLVDGSVASGVGRTVVVTAVASAVAELLDVALTVVAGAIRGRPAVATIKALVPMALASVPLYTPLVGTLSMAYRDVTPWTLALFFVPALAAQHLFALYQRQRELAEGLADLNATLEQANLSFASALIATLDARDRYTAGHSAAVAVYARDIAARMGLPERDQSLAHLCGLVHDIGKIGLPAGLLEKPGALTLDERREMQRHSEIGERILANVETYAEIAAVVRHHHERMDGNGYPDGISDEAIPLLARIIAVADAYNAMTSDRPYRDAMPTRVARLRLAQAVETQFDTSVVAAFEAILAGATEEYRQAKGLEFLWLEGEESPPERPLLSLAG
jgi:putative nucleotidyltransferase with HDIG domain